MPTKNYKYFCPTKQTRIVALFFGDFLVIVGSFFGYDPCLSGSAEIVVFSIHDIKVLSSQTIIGNFSGSKDYSCNNITTTLIQISRLFFFSKTNR